MKRSTNFSYTRKRRNPLADMALFLKDLGLSNDEIIEAVAPVSQELQTNVKQLAAEQGKTEIEIITALQAAAVKTGDEKLLNQLCVLKRQYIN